MEEEKLTRSLSARHIQMIALGGTIGAGLFMGASPTIRWIGPSVMGAYATAGLFLYLIMRALGEMLYVDSSAGSFVNYASEYTHSVAGYLIAWNNIFQYIVVGISEVIAVGSYMSYWRPNPPAIIPGIIVVLLLVLANLISVKAFGELEFWFSAIKVITVILMITAGLGVILFEFGNHGQAVGISNLWKNGGFFIGDVKGFFFALSIVVAPYQGIELIEMTAGEVESPKETIIEAAQPTIGRILIFYIGATFIIVSTYPWDQLSKIGSPFVQAFSKVGIIFTAGLINLVVITAALLDCSSGIFSASRMVYALAINGKMSKKFLKLSRHGASLYPVVAISGGILIGLILNYPLPMFINRSENIFVFAYSSSILSGMVPWAVISISETRFKKTHVDKMHDHPFRMPLSPYTNYATLAFLVIVSIFMFTNPETRISLIIGLVFLLYAMIHYSIREKRTAK